MISSHLTPEPERRLWVILDNVRGRLETAERKAAGLAFFAAAQAAFLKVSTGGGPLVLAGASILGAAVLLAGAAVVPFYRAPRKPAPPPETPSPDESLLFFGDLAKYSHAELVLKLEKYLGGGITGTPYHEDLIARIVVESRLAAFKHRLLRWAFAAAGLAQAAFLGSLLRG